MKLFSIRLMAAVMVCALPHLCVAQTAGDVLVRGGAMRITPKVVSGDLSGPSPSGTKTDNTPTSGVGGGITLMLTSNLSLDIPLAPPFKSSIIGKGAIDGVGVLGTVKALPATQFIQYRFFESTTAFRPYVGVGLTYAYFFDEQSSLALSGLTSPGKIATFKVKSKFAPTLQVGATYMFSDPYFVDIWYGKTFLKSSVTISTGQRQAVTINPEVLQIGFGRRF